MSASCGFNCSFGFRSSPSSSKKEITHDAWIPDFKQFITRIARNHLHTKTIPTLAAASCCYGIHEFNSSAAELSSYLLVKIDFQPICIERKNQNAEEYHLVTRFKEFQFNTSSEECEKCIIDKFTKNGSLVDFCFCFHLLIFFRQKLRVQVKFKAFLQVSSKVQVEVKGCSP